MNKLMIVLTLLCSVAANAQTNLVLNPGFEQRSSCPPLIALGGVGVFENYITHWTNSINWGEPKYYSKNCYGLYGQPSEQLLPRSGDAYAALIVTHIQLPGTPIDTTTWTREYMQGTLAQPLQKGKRYCVSFYVNALRDSSYLSNCAGLYFSDTPVSYIPSAQPVPRIFHQADVAAPTDRYIHFDEQWTKISGIYTATGSERHFVVGCFTPYAGLDTLYVADGTHYRNYIYYYFDDFSVTEMPYSGVQGDKMICPGGTAQLMADQGFDTYLWSTGATQPGIQLSQPGTYWVQMGNSCGTFTDTVIITNEVPPPPFSLGSDTAICAGTSIMLTAPAGYSYQWSTGATTQQLEATAGSIYTCEIKNKCGSTVDDINISATPVPQAGGSIITGDVDLCKNGVMSPGKLNTASPFMLAWSTGSTGHTIDIDRPGYYWLREYNDCGSNTDSVYIYGCEGIVGFPNAFTPNADGLNDIFRPIIQDISKLKSYRLTILNRWGQQVFTTMNPAEGWNGRSKGRMADMGTYFYHCYYIDQNNDKHRAKGDLMLLY